MYGPASHAGQTLRTSLSSRDQYELRVLHYSERNWAETTLVCLRSVFNFALDLLIPFLFSSPQTIW